MSVPFSSILEPGDFLFETRVTVEDVNKVITEQLGTESQLKSTSKFTVVGDGNGFLSRVILVEPEWTVPDNNLPDKFILKISSTHHIRGMMKKERADGKNYLTEEKKAHMWNHFEEVVRRMHNQEVSFYRFVRNLETRDKLMLPRMYFAKKIDKNEKGFIGLEYVKNPTVNHVFLNSEPTDLYPVLKAIATLQAATFSMTDEKKESLSDTHHLEAMGGMFSEDGIKGVFEQTRRIGDGVSEKVDRVVDLGKGLVDLEFIKNLNTVVGVEEKVLVHGDLWSTNILWKDGVADKIVDYQLIHFGNPAEDLVRFFVSTLSGAQRRQHWEDLLQKFYAYFLEALGRQEAPYSLEQLKESYRLYFVMGAMALLPMFGRHVEAKLQSFEAEQELKCREIIREKVECLLEDVVEWHLYKEEKIRNQ